MYLWPPVWWKDLCGVVNKGACVFVQTQSFWTQRKSNYMHLFKEKGWNLFFETGGWGELASCPSLFWCRPIADVVVQEERLTQPRLVMEGEGKKNSFATRQHVLLPVFVSTYYVLPACSLGWGDFKKKESLGPLEKNIKKVSHMATTM